jgi:hypothetical protein
MKAASAGGGLRLGWIDAFSHDFTADLSAAKSTEMPLIAVGGPVNVWRFFFILTAKN